MRVFLDANILFSAADPASASRQLLEGVLSHGEAVTNGHAWEEAWRNLDCKRPDLLDGLRDLASRIPQRHGAVPVPPGLLPDKDVPVLAGAGALACTHLWTSDRRHFGSHYGKMLLGVRVVSSVMLADELLAAGWRLWPEAGDRSEATARAGGLRDHPQPYPPPELGCGMTAPKPPAELRLKRARTAKR